MSTKTVSRIFTAGFKTAEVDHRRGMSHAAMRRVVQPDDNPEWAAGYTERAEQLISLDKMWEDG